MLINTPSISFYWPQTTTDGSVRVTVSNANNCGTQVRFFNIITNGALPVELLSFDGSCNDNVITLNWKTASEHNSQYFEIKKSGSLIRVESLVQSKIFLMSSFAEEFVSKYWKKALLEDFEILNQWLKAIQISD